jgi:hypothetical protein
MEQVAEGRVGALRPDDGASRRFDELDIESNVFADPQHGSGEDDVDVGLARDGWPAGISPANRDAMRLDRTIRESSPDNALTTASGRLNARKSIEGSGRSMRNGRTNNRLIARTTTRSFGAAIERHARSSCAMTVALGGRSLGFLDNARRIT